MIDDILVFGRTRQEHDARLSQVLSRLAKAGITLNEDKCRFGVSEVSFLGVVVSAKVIGPDPSKVEAVKAMEAPTDVAGVRRLLGMVNHLARFLPHISDVTAPIRALLNKSASWVWQHEQEAAFKKVKELLTSDRCMAKYHPSYATTRLRLKTMQYQFRMLHVPGKLLATADTLSRITHKASTPVDTVELFAAQVVSCMSEVLPLSPEDVRQAQESDGECKALISFCQRGWPPKTKLPLHVSMYASVADELSVCEGILLKGLRIVIPSSLRPAVLTLLHEGHQGINRTNALARESVWWPGISADIASLVANCEQCTSTRVNLAEPLVSTALPGRPWEFLGMDLFHLNGQTFLLVVDYYSRFPEVVTLRSTTARAVIDALKGIFARHGIPQDVRSDNGPPFSSQEFAAFAVSYGFNHATSSPHYAQSNGEAERMLRPNWPPRKDVVAKDVSYKRKQTDDYNRHHGARDLPPLQTGQRVWVRPDQVQATVLSPGQRPRSYVVETDRGGVLQRNRRHLVPFVPSASGEESLPTAAQQPSPPQQVLQEPQPANSMGPAIPQGSLCNIP
ncbi:uncharacterized protein LOC119391827 [Rhipicephalus sanguineus]|uniref:uncharacterized protein LOC119391827 n=1 Tax=Rhipicephalus sanguineus TaxID=34632 RepID=UPI00189381FF|nr:uncharacterized protein LOC119391827 [Rhipicephalus sanguineus]